MPKKAWKSIGTALSEEEYQKFVEICKQNDIRPNSMVRHLVRALIGKAPNLFEGVELIKHQQHQLETLGRRINDVYKLLLDEYCDLREDYSRHLLRHHFDDLDKEERERLQILLRVGKESKEVE